MADVTSHISKSVYEILLAIVDSHQIRKEEGYSVAENDLYVPVGNANVNLYS